ncbi:MAG: hypothetical protein P1U46_00425 [Patescibacteria group bacterium]|nr:hypothetical protein [Patescibacteria group bacterium]
MEDKSIISFSSLEGNSFFSHISSDAHIIPLLSTHLIAVFFIVTVSHQCQETVAHIFATATACQTSKFEPPHTICISLSSHISTIHTLKLSASV